MVIAIILLTLSNPIASKIAGKKKDEKIDITVKENELMEIILIAIGVFLVISGISGLTGSVSQAIASKIMLAKFGPGQDITRLDPRFWGELVGSTLKLIFGFILTFKFRGLNNAIKKLREA